MRYENETTHHSACKQTKTPPHILGTAEATYFKFGLNIEHEGL